MTLDLFTPPEADPQEWTQVYLSRLDRTYRYRVHLDRIQDLSAYDEMATDSWRFELEFLDTRDGRWREVRFYPRRLEIWALIRDRLQPGYGPEGE